MFKLSLKAIALVLLSASANVAYAQEHVKISIGTPSFGVLHVFVAEAMKTFEAAGLEAEIVPMGSGSKAVAAVVGGSADYTVTASGSVLNARNEGVKMTMIAGLHQQYTTTMVFSKQWADKNNITADSTLEQKLAALRGSTIATSGPGGGDQYIRYFAARAGLEPDRDMTIMHMGSDMAVYLGAMAQGRIDGFALGAPNPQIAVRDQGAVIAINTAVGEVPELDGFPYIVLAAMDDYLAKNPETAKKVVHAFQLAVDIMRDPAQSDAARDLVYTQSYSQSDKAIFDAAWAEAVVGTGDSVQLSRDKVAMVVDFMNSISETQFAPSIIDETFTDEFSASK